MEDKSKNVTCSKSSDWVECESKSKPGKKYLFNRNTGESQWLKPEGSATKAFSSPANDRLKRHQTELQKSKPLLKTKNEEKRSTTVIKTQKSKTTSKKTISTAALKLISPKDHLKILQCKAIKEQLNHEKTDSPGSLSSKSKVALIPETSKKSTQNEELLKRRAKKRNAAESAEIKGTELAVKRESLKVQKIQKPISKPPRDRIKTIESVTSCSLKVDNTKIITPKISKPLSQHLQIPTPEEIESKLPDLKFLTQTPKCNYPSLKRSKRSANDRLERIRKSLQNENIVSSQSSNSIENSLKNNNVEHEAMDWEPIEEPNAAWTGLDSPVVNAKFTYEEPTDMEVDENLMLVAAEEKQEMKKIEEKWLKNSVYVVLDTNVFIHHLSLIEELRTKKIIDAPDIVLYIPYSVLQELDKLKLRENIKVPVISAIRYLNKMFGEKNSHIQAQSALEERKHLIDVDSSDDSILNCCLQVQAYVSSVILLSEDINLQNKAMCNNITVSKISELLNKKFDFSLGNTT